MHNNGKKEINMDFVKRIAMAMGILLLLFVISEFSCIVSYLKKEPRPFSMHDKNEGGFPLYEPGFSKTISIDKQPLMCRFLYLSRR